MAVKNYETDGLVIHWNADLCEHAAKCVKGAPAVFDVSRRPWIMPENGTDEEIKKVIDQCPSGALTYTEK
ncbi:MAG: (4Fe-4S)-binding protein [Veillonella sp.]|uniref:(4Fe-4S)-binding protein n=1 Tax=Veillonella sp. TaxID=1926307 RepID=UPI0025DF3194|nr:(4Fe-4S)-binding protein [Veillonella sp.]MBE6080215.1 (4Fe-4S)-binding protein [Veillonella sp.]